MLFVHFIAPQGYLSLGNLVFSLRGSTSLCNFWHGSKYKVFSSIANVVGLVKLAVILVKEGKVLT